MTTGRLAAATGYSVQQVRDLERLGVIPSAVRMPNSYRRFGPEHVTALRAYRALAVAVGPVEARRVMHDVQVLPTTRHSPVSSNSTVGSRGHAPRVSPRSAHSTPSSTRPPTTRLHYPATP
ncbi:MerR family transcriptional regulator [Rhodococcus pyridinivorans]|uniref:MerR family transcriptional regulator n=1 Tax=Rhodococcus pyridinivorans TaxID=103816 RepID=UPI00352D2C55